MELCTIFAINNFVEIKFGSLVPNQHCNIILVDLNLAIKYIFVYV